MQQEKPTLLFVHGAWHGAWCWEANFTEFFKNAGYNVVTFNLPKHSKAGKVKGINRLIISDYVTALKAEVDKLPHPPIIIGHSMGGFVVQHYLKKHTAKAAILLAPSPHYGVILTTLKLSRKPYFYPALLGLNLYHLVNSPKKARFAFFSDALSENQVAHYSNQLCAESYLAFLGMLKPVGLGIQKQTPMLVVAAEYDNIFSVSDIKRTAKYYAADFEVIKGSGHDVMLDVKWQHTAQTMLGWLAKKLA